MKNTNAQTQNNITIKLALALTVSLFSVTSYSSPIKANELVKVEPIKQVTFYIDAKESLALSFDNIAISQDYDNEIAKHTINKQQKSAKKNASVVLSKADLISE